MELQSHLESRIDTPTYQILRVNLIMFFKSVLGLDYDEETILKICAICDTNAFEVRGDRLKVRGIYPNAAMIAHNCVANTRHSFRDNYELVFVATVDIQKGDIIYTTYGQALQVYIGNRVSICLLPAAACSAECGSNGTEICC